MNKNIYPTNLLYSSKSFLGEFLKLLEERRIWKNREIKGDEKDLAMEYTMWTVQNQGDATTAREISRATGILLKK